MKIRELIMTARNRIELKDADLSEDLEPHQALVRTEYSIVSAGTEGAAFTGLEEDRKIERKGPFYPRGTGYGNLGEVLAVGTGVTMCKPGDRVLSFSRHATHVKANAAEFALPVPKDVDGKKLVFARMAGVSIASLRSSSVQAGETVLVIGQGLVGNFAAQLFQLAGADVMVADLSDFRLEKARACGLKRTVNSGTQNLAAAVHDWTGGQGARAVVEAIGHSAVIAQAVMLAGKCGEVILLGSPRAHVELDATPMLSHIHVKAIHMIGALEWCWPKHETWRVRNLTDNYRQIVNWIAQDRLIVEPLLSHLRSPAEAQELYSGLTSRQDHYLAGVFDWSKLG